MTDIEHKEEFQRLKSILYKSHVVVHAKVTFLAEIQKFEILDNQVRFHIKYIKPLQINIDEYRQEIHEWLSKKKIRLGSPYNLEGLNVTQPLVQNEIISRKYCSYKMWFNPELVRFVYENEPVITDKVLKYLHSDQDWKKVFIDIADNQEL